LVILVIVRTGNVNDVFFSPTGCPERH
jgi:hypothetical protein